MTTKVVNSITKSNHIEMQAKQDLPVSLKPRVQSLSERLDKIESIIIEIIRRLKAKGIVLEIPAFEKVLAPKK